MTLRNVHERRIDAPTEVVGALLDRLASDDDPLWPDRWLPIRLDRPLQVGADGGHGDGAIRYHVAAYEPGRQVRFTFHPETGIDGYHELTVEAVDDEGDEACILRHVLEGQPQGLMRVLIPLFVRHLHDAMVEGLLDKAELAATGQLATPARWSPWVRFWRSATEFPRPRAVPIPDDARLASTAFERVDFADAWQAQLVKGVAHDPQTWADAIFRLPPAGVGVVLRLRNRLAPLIGVRPAHPANAFAPQGREGNEVLLGSDDTHLDFRASVVVADQAVTVSTVVRIHNRPGRFYMAIVRRLHPLVVRRMMRSAHRRLDRAHAVDHESGSPIRASEPEVVA